MRDQTGGDSTADMPPTDPVLERWQRWKLVDGDPSTVFTPAEEVDADSVEITLSWSPILPEPVVSSVGVILAPGSSDADIDWKLGNHQVAPATQTVLGHEDDAPANVLPLPSPVPTRRIRVTIQSSATGQLRVQDLIVKGH